MNILNLTKYRTCHNFAWISFTEIYISLYWNVPCSCSGTTRAYTRFVYIPRACLAISNEIAGGREAALILIQIVLARAIYDAATCRRDNVAATLVVITSPSASELTRSVASYGETPERMFSADSVLCLAIGAAVQLRQSRVSDRLLFHYDDHSLNYTKRAK